MLAEQMTSPIKAPPGYSASPSLAQLDEELRVTTRVLTDPWAYKFILGERCPICVVYTQDIELPGLEIANESVAFETGGYWLAHREATVENAFSEIEQKVDTPSEEDILSGMVSNDLVVHMPPRRQYTVRLKVTSIKKAEPNIVAPD